MDDYEDYEGSDFDLSDDGPHYYPSEVMCQKAEMILRMAKGLNVVDDPAASMLVLKAMDALLYTINPARGELKEIKAS